MWEFLSSVLEKAGFVATLYVLTLVGLGVAARLAWGHITGLNAKLLSAEKRATRFAEGTAAAVEGVRAEESEKRAAMRAEHAAELLAVSELRRAEAERFGDRIEARADRHSDQMVQLVEKSTKHIERIDSSIEKQTAVLDAMIRLGDGR